MSDDSSIRLNKFIAQHLNVGRRAADDLIAAGQVNVNDKPTELGARVRPGDIVWVQGRKFTVETAAAFVYLLMDKPEGYVCSRRQQGDAPTVYTILPAAYQHVKTVGRLDKNSSGLIMLTNDGDLAHRLTHPSFVKIKRYEVTLDKPLEPLHHQMIADHGIQLPDGPSKLQLERLHEGDAHSWLVTMHEGRNRQIRRTFGALGYDVARLHRIQFGPYQLAQLEGKQLLEVSPPTS
ncbi:MAG TPA: pseudouridine synthase [Candidatus Saccharimonadales bacterium]|nr:pseudouridine synthase [Candidatus Saccharimonadales bacterium]